MLRAVRRGRIAGGAGSDFDGGLSEVKRLLDLSRDMFCVATLDGWFLHLNSAWERCLGWTIQELLARPYLEFVHPDDLQATAVQAARLEQPGIEVVEFENRYRHRDGSFRWLAWNARTTSDADVIYAVARDVTDRRSREASLRTSEQFYRRIVESSDDAILSKDRHGVITTWNAGAERLYGYTSEEAVGRPVRIIIPRDRHGEDQDMLRAALGGDTVEHYETQRVTKDGRLIDVSLTVSALTDETGEVIGATAIGRDITERRRMERKLRYFADHDVLTGLLNRRRFAADLTERTRYAARYERSGAVLMIDLDNFKLINDSFGHREGDLFLKQFASELAGHARATDLLARLGGDEFALLLNEIEPREAVEVASKLRSTLAIEWRGRTVTASVGVAAFGPSAPVTGDDLMVAADIALYDAKEAGRNQVALYSGRERPGLSWAEQIRCALNEGRLTLDAQPILDLRSGELSQEELLVRMRGGDGEVIWPDAFLPTAERFGLIGQLDRWVVDQAVDLAAAGRRVEVNISGASMCDRDLTHAIEERLRATGAQPQNLVFEITETAAIANMEEAREFAEHLCELGCGFALDDFGTGFGSFTYLKQLPVSYLKIDADFVRHVTTDRADRYVIEAVVALARGFGQQTIAEGVENQETLEALVGYGVDWAQGYHIGRPAPVDGMAAAP
ncbi:MAG TPA: EAL domain-containing protein [Solirubrobacteraceae bacterium]|nr:EAL domain-containing protein [Solirubrobacteraceae bacterium]